MMGKRNAHALAALQRKAGAHSDARRPDVFDRINAYNEARMEELQERARDYGIGDYVRVLVDGPFHDCVGVVVSLDYNIDGAPLWTVDFEDGAPFVTYLETELERFY
jgi:hypothetical protein